MRSVHVCPTCGRRAKLSGDRRLTCPFCGECYDSRDEADRAQLNAAIHAAPGAARRLFPADQFITPNLAAVGRPLAPLSLGTDAPAPGAYQRPAHRRIVIALAALVLAAGCGASLVFALRPGDALRVPGADDKARALEDDDARGSSTYPRSSPASDEPANEPPAKLPEVGSITTQLGSAALEHGQRCKEEQQRIAYHIFRRDCGLLFEEEKQLSAAYEKDVQGRYDRMRELGLATRGPAEINLVMQLAREADAAARDLLPRLESVHARARQLARKEHESSTPYEAVWARYAQFMAAKLQLARGKQAFFMFRPARGEYLPTAQRLNQLDQESAAAFRDFAEELKKVARPEGEP